MTAYLAGIVQVRCADHPKASDIDGVVRAVLAAMAYPVRDARSKCSESQRYLCTESVSKIAGRCGFERKVVMRAQERAADLALIECLKAEPKKPKHWRLAILVDEDMSLSGTSEPREDMSPTGTSHVPDRDKTCTSEGHNPQSSPVALAKGDDDDRAAAVAAGSAGAPPTAAAPSMQAESKPRAGSVGYIMAELGLSRTGAETWRERKLARKPGEERITNEIRWIVKCVKTELEQSATAGYASGSARKATAGSGKKPPKGVPTDAKRSAPRKRGQLRAEEKSDVARRSRAGEDHATMAEELRVNEHLVDKARKEADYKDARAAFDGGADIANVTEQFGKWADTTRIAVWAAVDAIWADQPLDRFGEEAATRARVSVERDKTGALEALNRGASPQAVADRWGSQVTGWARAERARQQAEARTAEQDRQRAEREQAEQEPAPVPKRSPW